MKLRHLALALTAMPFAMNAQAGDVTLTPMGGYHVYDQKLDRIAPPGVDNAPVYGGSVGYGFTPNISGEIEYLRTSGDRSSAPGKINDDHLSVNGLYHFNSSSAVQPYVLLGVGQGRFKAENGPASAQDTVVNAGVGSFYQLSDNLRLRGELRAVHNTDASYTDGMALVGLEVRYGSGNGHSYTSSSHSSGSTHDDTLMPPSPSAAPATQPAGAYSTPAASPGSSSLSSPAAGPTYPAH